MKPLTKEQSIFKEGKELLKRLDDIREQRPLTEKEEQLYQSTQVQLLNTVIRFGMQQARKRMQRYRLDVDAYQDVQMSLTEMFFRKLPDYDPERTTPTTFYLRYFDQCISEYLHSYSQNLSQYDAANVALVRSAMKDFNMKGISWTEEMIAAKTGLSIKVTRKTISMAQNSVHANIDDVPYINSKDPTPEEVYLQQEKQEVITQILKKKLSNEEFSIFMYRLNLDGPKQRTFRETAEHFGVEQKIAKNAWNRAVGRLRTEPELLQFLNRKDGIKIRSRKASG